ncbi:hypothetical protein CaCOL14_012290 [Colletotrichum acutatum]
MDFSLLDPTSTRSARGPLNDHPCLGTRALVLADPSLGRPVHTRNCHHDFSSFGCSKRNLAKSGRIVGSAGSTVNPAKHHITASGPAPERGLCRTVTILHKFDI